MRSRLALILSALILAMTASAAFAQTTNVLGGGININEFLADPNGTANCDTDSSGTANTTDEFVELHNNSGSTINIGGYQIWDAGGGNWFTFPGGTMVDAGGFALVVVGVQAGGSLPAVAPGSVAFDDGGGSGILNNTGDNVVVYDPVNDEYIQAVYNGASTDDPTTYSGFSATATRVGTVDNFGNDTDGVSLTRDPDGSTAPTRHNKACLTTCSPGVTLCLPVELQSFDIE